MKMARFDLSVTLILRHSQFKKKKQSWFFESIFMNKTEFFLKCVFFRFNRNRSVNLLEIAPSIITK